MTILLHVGFGLQVIRRWNFVKTKLQLRVDLIKFKLPVPGLCIIDRKEMRGALSAITATKSRTFSNLLLLSHSVFKRPQGGKLKSLEGRIAAH